MPHRANLTDTKIIAGIREATAAWNAPQDTDYYAERFGCGWRVMHDKLCRLAAAGRLVRVTGYGADKWRVKEEG